MNVIAIERGKRRTAVLAAEQTSCDVAAIAYTPSWRRSRTKPVRPFVTPSRPG